MRWPSDKNLKKINWALYGVIVCSGVYLIIAPFLPQITFKISNIVDMPSKTINTQKIDRNTNQLYIPSVKLTKPILDGDSPKTVNRGIWRVPTGSSPARESNTVLVGHRFSYKNPSVFYHLDKVEHGDTIYVSWNKKIYVYKVDQIRTVTPDTTSVEDPSDEPKLTIYTCTPLWSTSHRLVIQSKLDKVL